MMLHLIKYRPLRDRIILWAFLGVLAFCGLFPYRPKGVYLSDPFSAATLTAIAISAAFSAGSYALNYYIAKKRKVAPVDRGRMEDFRLQANGYGEHIMRGYGKFRTAGFVLDATSIVHSTSTTPGRPGGKGAPKPPEPGTINHIYTTTADIGVCESLGALSPNLRVLRVWENLEPVYDVTVATEGDGFYEAERPGNTLAGGAVVVADASASDSQSVSLPTNGSVQFNGVFGDGVGVVEFYYRTTAANTVELTVNAMGAAFTATLENTGGEWYVYRTESFTMFPGYTNTLKVKNTHASTMYVDNMAARVSGRGTGIINPRTARSTADDYDTIARYGFLPAADGDGTTTGQIVAGGNANIRIYSGSETQEPDSAFVAIHGAGKVPAYRGLCHVVFDGYVLKDPALPNFSFEVDTGCYDIDDIVTDLYSLVNVTSSKVDVTALAGLSLGSDEGFLLTSREEAGRWLGDLMTVYQFDMVEADGKAKAVLRSGSSVAAVAADELRAHWDNEEEPQSEIDISDADPLALPGEVAVGYMDALLDYHQNVQTASVGSGVFGDRQTVNVSMILSADHARQLAETILWQRHMEARTFKLRVGPKYQKYHPGDVLTVNTTNAAHTVRLGEHRWQLMGVQEFEGVRHAASVYTQTIPGTSGSGYEAPVIPYPGNTRLVIMDLPALRPEDAGDGTQPVHYKAVCLQGEGTWRGAFAFKERPIGSESYTLESTHDLEAAIGVIESGSIGSVDETVWDRATSFVVNFFPSATLENVAEADALNNPELNLAAIGSGSTWYVFQFTARAAEAAASPYRARYTLSGLLWDRFGSGVPPAGSLAGLYFVLLNSAVKPGIYPLEDVGQPRLYKCPTAGQSVEDAETVMFTGAGTSLKPLSPANLRGQRNRVDDLLIEWTRRERIASTLRDNVGTPRNEEAEIYQLEIYDGATLLRTARITGQSAVYAVDWVTLQSNSFGSYKTYSDTGEVSASGSAVVSAQSFRTYPIRELVMEVVTADPAFAGMPSVGFGEVGQSWSGGVAAGAFYLARGSANDRVRAEGDAASEQTAAEGDRFSIQVQDGRVSYFKNWTSPLSVPFYVSPRAIPGDRLRAYTRASSIAGAVNVSTVRVKLSVAREFLYTAAMQSEDFGSTQSSVKVRVYQESALVGRGYYTEANL